MLFENDYTILTKDVHNERLKEMSQNAERAQGCSTYRALDSDKEVDLCTATFLVWAVEEIILLIFPLNNSLCNDQKV